MVTLSNSMMGGSDLQSTGLAWWSGNARLINLSVDILSRQIKDYDGRFSLIAIPGSSTQLADFGCPQSVEAVKLSQAFPDIQYLRFVQGMHYHDSTHFQLSLTHALIYLLLR